MDVSLSLCLGVLTYSPLALPVLHWCELAWFLLLYHIQLYKWLQAHRLQDPFMALPPGNIWVIKGCRKWQQSQCAHHLPFLGVQQWCCSASLPYLELCRRVGSLRSRMSGLKCNSIKWRLPQIFLYVERVKAGYLSRDISPMSATGLIWAAAPKCCWRRAQGLLHRCVAPKHKLAHASSFAHCFPLHLSAGEAHSQLSGWGEGPG